MAGFTRSARMGMIAAMLVISSVAAANTASATTSSFNHPSVTAPAACALATGGPKSEMPPSSTPPNLVGITAASGACGDRVIFEVAPATLVGYQIGYERDLLGIGSGLPIDVAGRATLVVNLDAPAYDDAGRATIKLGDTSNLVSVSDLTSVQQVVWAGSLRGVTRVGIGVDRVRPFSVTVEPGKRTTEVIVEIAP